MELSEFEEIPLGLTQMVEKEWEGNGIGEASDRSASCAGQVLLM